MNTFCEQCLHRRHNIIPIFFLLSCFVSYHPALVFAVESHVLRDSSATFEITLSCAGKLKFPAGNEQRSDSLEVIEQPVHAHSTLIYQHKPKADGSKHTPELVRHYDHAASHAVVGRERVSTQLPRGVTDIHVCTHEAGLDFWYHEGFLTQPEADLLTVAFDPIYLDALVPPSNHSCGTQWELSQSVVANLLCIDTAHSGGLKAEITESNVDRVVVKIEGEVEGAVNGAKASIVVDGSYDWTKQGDTAGNVSMLHIVIKESRDVSYTAPGFDIEAVIKMSRYSQATSSPRIVATSSNHGVSRRGRSRRGPGKQGFRWVCDPYNRYDIVYGTNWKIIEESSDYLMMRLIDRGALVGQVTVTPLPPQSDVLTLSDFANDIETALGEQFGNLESASRYSRDDGTEILRVASVGEAENLPFHWIHYHLRAVEGQRLSLAFMVESRHMDRFLNADRQYIEGVDLSLK